MKRLKPYTILSAKVITIIALIAVALSFGLVFFLGHKSVFAELQITLLIISAGLFTFFLAGLYNGVRIKDEPLVNGEWKPLNNSTIGGLGGIDVPDVKFLDIGDDIGGIIISIILWIVVSIVLLSLLFLMANIIWGIIFVLAIIIYWISYRAFRLVFIKSRKCRGNLLMSLLQSIRYTVLYTGWIFILIWVGRFLIHI